MSSELFLSRYSADTQEDLPFTRQEWEACIQAISRDLPLRLDKDDPEDTFYTLRYHDGDWKYACMVSDTFTYAWTNNAFSLTTRDAEGEIYVMSLIADQLGAFLAADDQLVYLPQHGYLDFAMETGQYFELLRKHGSFDAALFKAALHPETGPPVPLPQKQEKVVWDLSAPMAPPRKTLTDHLTNLLNDFLAAIRPRT